MEQIKSGGIELSPEAENWIVCYRWKEEHTISQSVITDSIMSRIQTLKHKNYKMSASLAKVEFHFWGVLTTNLGNQDLSTHHLVNCWDMFIS